MKNLITQKLTVTLLIACVLAFSVHGVADALTFGTSRSGDLQTASINQEFKISFSVSLKSSSTTLKDSDDNNVDQYGHQFDDEGYYGSLQDHDTDSSTPQQFVRAPIDGDGDGEPEDKVTDAARYHYNEERVRISVVTGGANILKVGTYDVTPTSDLTLMETGERGGKLNNRTNPLTLSLPSTAVVGARVTISIEDMTPVDDLPNGAADHALPQTFTVYVVEEVAPDLPALQTLPALLSWDFAEVPERYKPNGNDFDDETIVERSDTNHFRATYEVIEGSGELYVREGNRRSSSTRTLSTSTAAAVHLDMDGTTNKVKASIAGVKPRTAIFIFGYPNVEIVSGNNQEGALGGRLEEPLVVKVTDGTGRAISGLAAEFKGPDPPPTDPALFFPVPGTAVYVAGDDESLAQTFAFPEETVTATSTHPGPASVIRVQTNSRGEASAYFQLGGPGARQTVTVSAGGSSLLSPFRFAGADSDGVPSIEIVSGNNQRSVDGNVQDPLVVVVRNRGQRVPNELVTFTTNTGVLDGADTDIEIRTDGQGRASVTYSVGDFSGTARVVASIEGTSPLRYRREVTFYINGSGPATGNQQQQQQQPATNAALSFTQTSITGGGGESVSLIVSARDSSRNRVSGVPVSFSLSTTSGSVSPTAAVTDSNGEARTTVVLPSSSATLTASAVGYLSAQVSLTVTATTQEEEEEESESVALPADLFIDGDSALTGERNAPLSQGLIVRVVDANGNGVSGELVAFRVTEGRGRLAPVRTRTDSVGYADVSFTPLSDGTIAVEASSGDLTPVYFTITTGEPPSAIVKVSGDNQSGRPGGSLANPFVVEVVDADDEPVSGVTVAFAVTAGGGSVSPASATTNANGRAQTTLTLGDEPGANSVAARVSGLTTVDFTATSGMQVLVNASQRPPMYWLSRAEGTLYRLVAADIEPLAPNVTGVTGIAVDAAHNTLYLAVQTAENRGEIRSAALTGRNVRTLKTLTAVPMGIAVDSAGGTVYWTNSRGRIQSIATQGSAQLTNVLQNLPNPGPIAISNGHLYWGEASGRVRRVNITATRQTIQNVATGLGAPLSLAIAKNKLYWIERSAGGSGSVNRSNLDGSNPQTLKTFASGVPTSLAVDSSDNKIYWTKGTGKIQRANLAGRFVKDIATGVMNPAGIALGVVAEMTAPATGQQANNQPSNTQPPTYSQYDVNQDGAVNNADTRAVAAAIGQSGEAITNPRTDVDGSGAVDVTDLILVIANLDDEVAAPTLAIDVKALDIDFDRVQEQVEVLLASGDPSIAAQRALLYLQHLLASARPDETVLLANYPNPFNPETWIPYHLSESTTVKINIYDAKGALIRVLPLGHQSAGYYTSRSRAAYWDGRNALGEPVASGVYFYQLETDTMSPMRKMVILK